MSNVHISIKAEPLIHSGPIYITNSMVIAWVVSIFMIVIAYLAFKNKKVREILEIAIEGLFGFFEDIAGKHTRKFFPLIATFFFFILLSNWSGLIPGVGTIGYYASHHGEKVFTPILRGATADLNTTFALGIVSVVLIQYFFIKTHGIVKYVKEHFLNPMGILEVFTDLAKILSFSFRLFGNVFAGEVLLSIIAFLMPIAAPLPFLGLEVFIGFIQALVFAVLSLIFFQTATEH